MEKARRYEVEPAAEANFQPGQRSRRGLKLSVKSRDTFGRSQEDYAASERRETYRTGKMKKRHLKQLDAEERTAIASCCLRGDLTMAQVASKHHISAGLAGRITKDSKGGSMKIAERKQQEEQAAAERSIRAPRRGSLAG